MKNLTKKGFKNKKIRTFHLEILWQSFANILVDLFSPELPSTGKKCIQAKIRSIPQKLLQVFYLPI